MTAPSPLTPDEVAAVRRPYRAASLLPGRAYHDPGIHEFERIEWFRRDWVVVGREEDAAVPGTYFLWDLTNRQDWHVCELQHVGTRSWSWTAGRYSNQEPSVHAFDLMAVDRYAGDGVHSRRTVRTRYDVPPPREGAHAEGAPAEGAGARARR